MSLINQMLRDLEQRQAGARHQNDPFRGLTSTPGQRTSRLPLLVLGALVIVLAGGLGYLWWDRGREPAPEPAPIATTNADPAPTAPVVPPSPAVAEPAVPPVVQAEPAPAPTPVPPPAEVASVPSATPPSPVAPKPQTAPKPAAKPRPKPAPAAEAPSPAPEPESAPVTKTMRALTPRQQAAAACQQGYAALRDGRKAEAEALFKQALEHDAGYSEAREALAGLWLAAGRWVEARGLLEEGSRLHPDNARFRFYLSRVRLQQGEAQGALAVLEEGLSQVQPDGDYLATAAALHQRLGNPVLSAERYQQALALDGRQGAWWLGLAIALEATGKGGDAAQAFRRALETGLDPKLAAYARERIEALRQTAE